MKKIFLLFLIVCMVFSLGACGGTSDGSKGQYKYFLTVSHAEINMEQGDEFSLKASYSDNQTAALFASDNENIATVSQDGTVRAVGVGECYIIVKAGEAEKSCKVTVSAPIYSIELIYADAQYVVVGAKVSVTAIRYKDGVKMDGTFAWSVNPTANCKLEANGNIAVFSATEEGQYTINVSDGKCVAQCVLNVVMTA